MPITTAIIPLIGHTGILTSKGVIHDFYGFININKMAFGNPTKYVPLDHLSYNASQWHNNKSDRIYNNPNNLQASNRHSYCDVLNKLNYKGRDKYTMIDVFLMITFQKKHISLYHFIKSYIGFIIFIAIVWLLFKRMY